MVIRNKIIFEEFTFSNQSIIHDIFQKIIEFKNLLLNHIYTFHESNT